MNTLLLKRSREKVTAQSTYRTMIDGIDVGIDFYSKKNFNALSRTETADYAEL